MLKASERLGWRDDDGRKKGIDMVISEGIVAFYARFNQQPTIIEIHEKWENVTAVPGILIKPSRIIPMADPYQIRMGIEEIVNEPEPRTPQIDSFSLFEDPFEE